MPDVVTDWCAPWVDADDEIKILQINRCDRSPTLKTGERYIGYWVGFDGTKNVFAVQVPPTSANEVRWGRCVTNWYNSGTNCDYVAVQEIKGCSDFALISFDESDPNYEDDFPTEDGGEVIGYRVKLPIAEVAQESR